MIGNCTVEMYDGLVGCLFQATCFDETSIYVLRYLAFFLDIKTYRWQTEEWQKVLPITFVIIRPDDDQLGGRNM
jgi:hypothetical protein